LLANFLLSNITLVTILWVLVYLSDYYLTIYYAKFYRLRLQEHIRFEGSIELTPIFQKDIDKLSLVSKAFLLRLVLSILLVPLIGWLCLYLLEMTWPYEFFMGGLFLREAAVLARHFRNISLAHDAAVEGSLRGSIEYSRWLIVRTSGSDLLTYALLFLLIALCLGSWFFFGGGIISFITALQHRAQARKLKPLPVSAAG
jgi:hypothetical protein